MQTRRPAPGLAPVSWDRMIRGVEKVRERLSRAASALENAGVPYAVAEGLAIAAHVSKADETAVRNTRDIDLLLNRRDLGAARRALESAGFVHRRVTGLGRPTGMDVFLDGPEGSVREAIHIVLAGERVRPDSPVLSPQVAESEEADQFRVVTLHALVGMKLSAFRDKDRTHLRDLLELGLIDDSWSSRFPATLARRLQELVDHPE